MSIVRLEPSGACITLGNGERWFWIASFSVKEINRPPFDLFKNVKRSNFKCPQKITNLYRIRTLVLIEKKCIKIILL